MPMPEETYINSPLGNVVIACGGTGGHLFPGLAVGQELRQRGCSVTLMVSPKDVDQQAIQSIAGMGIVTLPAVGLSRAGFFRFLNGLWRSYRLARACFAQRPPRFVLAMGGYISAPPVIAARLCGAKTFLHESNSIPGRANRWLARWVDGAFVFFPPAAEKLAARRVEVVGMPVRPQFLEPITPGVARAAMGLAPEAPVLLVMGGSQGARKVNELMVRLVPQLRQAMPNLQVVHLTGEHDLETVRARYKALEIPAVVHAFWNEMAIALAAADVAVSRAGASSLAELAARQLPAVLIPYPSAANNHQFHNARAFVQSGAARMLPQDSATPEHLVHEILELIRNPLKRSTMQSALARWHTPAAAADMAERILHWPAADRASHVPGPKFKPQNLGPANI
ncbi:MAG: undecaprenyldiphospho-muramoylpentapeptide beta-N-acetylglucosaminyltransferase [Verrucomicrobiota bacterium]|jgi:UDP-N-acetylglucosamine--N-acetylmuramyl-(pentapeptide) pyrophosphoryl-undecaprenol N-acetylglucosamine transferase